MSRSYKIYLAGVVLTAVAAFYFLSAIGKKQDAGNRDTLPPVSRSRPQESHPGRPVRRWDVPVNVSMHDGRKKGLVQNVDVVVRVTNYRYAPIHNVEVMVTFTQTFVQPQSGNDQHFDITHRVVVPGPIEPHKTDSLVVRNAFTYLWKDYRPEKIEAGLFHFSE
jgi:hypothetical protein